MISPETGEKMSEAALTDSTAPSCSIIRVKFLIYQSFKDSHIAFLFTSFSNSLTWRWDLDENDVSETLLGVVSDTNGTDIVLNGNPLVFFGISLGCGEINTVLEWSERYAPKWPVYQSYLLAIARVNWNGATRAGV
jgi:hypothetical protein